MKLKSISFENYKAFKEKQTLEIRPITLIIGKNSSGKSCITKLFTLLENSLSGSISLPLLMTNHDVELGAEFRDLVYGRETNSSISFTINYEDNISLYTEVLKPNDEIYPRIIEWKLNYGETNIIEFSINQENFLINKKTPIDMSLKGFIPNEQYFRDFFSDMINDSRKAIENNSSINFNNLREFLLSKNHSAKNNFIEIIELNQLIGEMSIDVDYIGPFRELPQRNFTILEDIDPFHVGSSGGNAYNMLVYSKLHNEDLHTNVSQWYQQYFANWHLDIDTSNSPYYNIFLENIESGIKINLVDVGQGMHQALPLIVRAHMEEEDSIIVLEQPELHLHTAAHADLAELFAKSAKNYNQTFIIETHSENILLRLRKLVVENDFGFTSDDIIIYWVDKNENGGQKINPIYVDEEGTLTDWPEGVFDENLKEIFELNKAIEKKQK